MHIVIRSFLDTYVSKIQSAIIINSHRLITFKKNLYRMGINIVMVKAHVSAFYINTSKKSKDMLQIRVGIISILYA
ncbi:hypothetical protein JCM15548_14609 [Geofilum rubicundum JCM 15548]|uniref:Uncharacterized protein n=1 Tax=Geofilum rubicundum JCM 15548 TaxID=1236989 RepID=A0A0E9LR82_9BACT|nr:hypothetical protein JCM15548_14609 [Geofilum rubicundum JCM 15548]